MTTRMLIDALHPEEMRVVIAENNHVREFDFVTSAKKQLKGNIYLAKVTRVEPSLQAAFVEYGGGKQGFLPFAEIHPDYYQIPIEDRKRLIEEAQREADEEEAREEAEELAGGPPMVTPEDLEKSLDDFLPPAIEGETIEHAMPEETPADEAPKSEEPAVSDDAPAAALEAEEKPETSDVETIAEEEDSERRTRKPGFTRRYKIQEVIRRNQILLVQVIKEERGNKGVSLTSYLSLAGRYCVLMPNSPKGGGISRKIASGEDRRRLKELSSEFKVADGMSVIIRTAGVDRTRAEIKRDYDYLMLLWNTIREQTIVSTAPALIYEEGNLLKRSIRDLYTADIDEILVEGEEAFNTAKEFMKGLLPSHAARVKQYKGQVPLFYAYEIEEKLLAMHDPIVRLKSGGYIVLNSTEALIAIDVNSGRATGERNIEETATRTNLEAAHEVARQLRLRDLAGLIVIDFIDMMEGRHRRQVERAMKDALKHDRARLQVGRISPFGLMEMSRQRLRPSISESNTVPCPHCQGRGVIRSNESLGIQIIRALAKEAGAGNIAELKVYTSPAVASFLFNQQRQAMDRVEQHYDIKVAVQIDPNPPAAGFRIEKIKLPKSAQKPQPKADEQAPVTVEAIVEEEPILTEDATDTPAPAENGEEPRRRRRRGKRGGRRRKGRDQDTPLEENASADHNAVENTPPSDDAASEGNQSRGRRRGGRRRWRDKNEQHGNNHATASSHTPGDTETRSIPSADSAPASMPQVVTPMPANDTAPTEDKPKKQGWWRRMVE